MEGDRGQAEAGDMVLSPAMDHAYWSATEPARWCPVVCCIALPGGTWELVPSAPKHLSLIGS